MADKTELRIAFCGASGTGKTTLATWLAEHLEIPYCDVGSRQVAAEMGLKSPYDVDRLGKRSIFQRKLFFAKRDWEEQRLAFVSDRTHLDNLIYTRLHAPETASPEYEASCRAACERYTHVFFCPMSAFHDVGDDTARMQDSRYHDLYESWIYQQYRLLPSSITRHTLAASDLDSRKQDILSMLEHGTVADTL